MKSKILIYSLLLAFAAASSLRAEPVQITKWTFDSLPRGQNNEPQPDFGPGSALAIGTEDPEGNPIPPNADVLASLRQGSDSSTPGNAWRIRSTGAFNGYSPRNLTTGAEFRVPTTGHRGITVSLEWIPTNNAPGHGQFQYTVNGEDFLNFGEPVQAEGGNLWIPLEFDLTALQEVDNNPLFAFRFVAAYNPNPFTLLTQDEEFNFITIEYGPNEAFVNASDTGLAVVTEPWSPDGGNFRFDTIVVSAAESMPPSDPIGYPAWVAAGFSPEDAANESISGPLASPRGDGFLNLQRYASGFGAEEPLPASARPSGSFTTDGLALTFSRAKNRPDLTFIPEVSMDLVTWQSGPEWLVEEVEDLEEVEKVTVRPVSPAGTDGTAFLRLRLVLQPASF